LPLELKEKARLKLLPFMTSKSVGEVVSYMLAEDWSEQNWPEFKKYTALLDQNRHQQYTVGS
jgi:hypothetical protein